MTWRAGRSSYETNEIGTDEIFVRPFPDTNRGRWRVSTGGGVDPIWAPDGKRLYYRSGQSMMAVAIGAGPPPSWGIPEKLFQLDGRYVFSAGTGSTEWDIAPDGRRFLMIKEGAADEQSARQQIVVVQNWFEELRRIQSP